MSLAEYRVRSGLILKHGAQNALLATLIVFFSATAPAFARQINVAQNGLANVYASVQIGRQVKPTSVTQVGQVNMAGIVQIGSNARASISQTGRMNGAFISQFNTLSTRNLRFSMP